MSRISRGVVSAGTGGHGQQGSDPTPRFFPKTLNTEATPSLPTCVLSSDLSLLMRSDSQPQLLLQSYCVQCHIFLFNVPPNLRRQRSPSKPCPGLLLSLFQEFCILLAPMIQALEMPHLLSSFPSPYHGVRPSQSPCPCHLGLLEFRLPLGRGLPLLS